MKIAVVGSREFTDERLIKQIVFSWFYGQPIHHEFISGGARGVDSIAEKWIDYLNDEKYIIGKNPNIEQSISRRKTKKIIYKPDWDDLSQPDAIIKINKFGKKYDARAGMRRNKLIIDEADMVLAFWNGSSKGTKHSIDLAIKAGKPLNIYVR